MRMRQLIAGAGEEGIALSEVWRQLCEEFTASPPARETMHRWAVQDELGGLLERRGGRSHRWRAARVPEPPPARVTAPDSRIEHADADEWLIRWRDGCAKAVVFDPPYAVGTPVRG